MFNSLSGRFLVLTMVFVMLAEILIFVPSVARFREDYLLARLERAQIASLASAAALASLTQARTTRVAAWPARSMVSWRFRSVDCLRAVCGERRRRFSREETSRVFATAYIMLYRTVRMCGARCAAAFGAARALAC